MRLVRDAHRRAYLACSHMFMTAPQGTAILEAQARLDDQIEGAKVHLPMLEARLRDYFAWYERRLDARG